MESRKATHYVNDLGAFPKIDDILNTSAICVKLWKKNDPDGT